MSNESRVDLIKQIQSDYHKKLKELESQLAIKHKELNQIEKSINHESKKIYDSKLPTLKAKKGQLNASILKLKKEIKRINKEKAKKLKKV